MPTIPGYAGTKTLNDLIEETRAHLIGNANDRYNLLASDVDALTTTLPMVNAVDLIGDGVRVDIGTETMYVWAANSSSGSLSVRRADGGSTATTHSAQDLVRINPRWTGWRILQAINSEILGLSSAGLFQVKTQRIAWVTCQLAYELPVDCVELYSVVRIGSRFPARNPVENASQVMDPTVTSGKLLYVNDRWLCPGDTLLVTYRAGLSQLSALTDSVAATTGLPESALDIVPMGAALRLDSGQAIERTNYDSLSDTAAANATHTSDMLNSPSLIRALRQSRIAEEKRALRRAWPPIGGY